MSDLIKQNNWIKYNEKKLAIYNLFQMKIQYILLL